MEENTVVTNVQEEAEFENYSTEPETEIQENDEEAFVQAEEESLEEIAEKTVPLAALHSEREKLKEIKRKYAESKEILDKIMEKTGSAGMEQLKEKMERAEYNAAIRSGLSPEAAQMVMKQAGQIKELRAMQEEMKFSSEINLLRQNPFYSDIDAVSEQVKKYAREKRLSAKEAYNALYAESRINSMKESAMQIGQELLKEKQQKKISALSSYGNVSGATRAASLSADELWAAKTAGMSADEYLKFKEER